MLLLNVLLRKKNDLRHTLITNHFSGVNERKWCDYDIIMSGIFHCRVFSVAIEMPDCLPV